METITVQLNNEKARKLILKYSGQVFVFFLLSIIWISWLIFRRMSGVFGLLDIVLILGLVVTPIAGYGIIKIIGDIRRNRKSGTPILVLTSAYIDLNGERVMFNDIHKVITYKTVTFIYRNSTKKLIRILPYMRDERGMKIDKEFENLWNK